MDRDGQHKKDKTKDFLYEIPNLITRQTLEATLIADNRSFVGRAANRITDGQRRAYEKGMQEYGLLYNPSTSLRDMIAQNSQKHKYEKIILDIGFGSGHSLCAMARKYPNILFIGIETFKPGIGSLFVQCYKNGIQNIRVFHYDAVPVLFHICEENMFDRIQIFFPDPWRKERHKKRRLIQKRFLQLCLHFLKNEGILWIVSDWEDYAMQIDSTLKLFERNIYSTLIPHATSYLKREKELVLELEKMREGTRFERKGLEKGHSIYPFVCVKQGY